MEVGAVKQAFNNELILLKKKLNQAKIQTINKLTRKAKTLAEKKAPEKLKEKLKKKAASAVMEVMIMKKIQVKDIGKFIITHTGELKDYLNKPTVDNDKACARLLLHKSMQDKYKFIRGRFNNVPIEDLLMSRQERKKLKEEARDKQKNKKKGKDANKAVNSEGHWDVEDVEMDDKIETSNNNEVSDNESENSEMENKLDKNSDSVDDSQSDSQNQRDSESENDDYEDKNEEYNSKDEESKWLNKENKEDSDKSEDLGKFVRLNPIEKSVTVKAQDNIKVLSELKERKKPEKKLKDNNKNKNFNEKILLRKFKKGCEEEHVEEKKIVDPFFITATGENYMSVAEPRQPDEVKEIHKQGNRKLRRAAMFGHVPKIKPRSNNFMQKDSTFDKQNGFDRTGSGFKGNFNDRLENNINRISKFNPGKFNTKTNVDETKTEKLHPSWEAKKRQSGILPFKGKKIVFDES